METGKQCGTSGTSFIQPIHLQQPVKRIENWQGHPRHVGAGT